jgi:hypothetical protein
MRGIVKWVALAFALLLCVGTPDGAQARKRPERKDKQQGTVSRQKRTGAAAKNAARGGPVLRARFEQCATSQLRLRLLTEYGAMFAADARQVLLPDCFFRSGDEVARFQRRAGVSSAVVNGVSVELQPRALSAYLEARGEAKRRRLEITPRGTRASRRSYADTARLWSEKLNAALSHWVGAGRLTKSYAEGLRSLAADRQLAEVLALEKRGLYFGSGYSKSILQSVAAVGTSQHNAMLALDVEQHADPRVRAILGRHGWFQTVRNDEPHFTFLGVEESALPSLGLRQFSGGGRTYWVASGAGAATGPADSDAEDEEAARSASGAAGGQIAKNIPATASAGVLLSAEIKKRLRTVALLYWQRTGQMLHITSGRRTAYRQAHAMHDNIATYGRTYVLGLYGGHAAVREIIAAYEASPRNPAKAIRAMTEVIRSQIRRGTIISEHLLDIAVDVRSRAPDGARLSILREIVRSVGGIVLVEKDHYHVGLCATGGK